MGTSLAISYSQWSDRRHSDAVEPEPNKSVILDPRATKSSAGTRVYVPIVQQRLTSY
jgi:hypothetical protein